MKAPESGATRLQHHITIQRPVEEVFNYVSTPARWPEWHPSSLRVSDEAAHPLPAGARFEEDIHAGGKNAHLDWVVHESSLPLRFIAEARADNGINIVLRYDLESDASGTRFTRTLDYTMPNLLWRIANRIILKRRINAESEDSLKRLKQALETGQAVMG